jgi:peptidoglycan/LPS O-acetylase OafA/YrhL
MPSAGVEPRPASAPRSRLPALDVLRAAAVILVIGRHIIPPPDAPWLLRAWNHGGWIGVDLFFVLSGFLVSGLLFKELRRYGTVQVPSFLMRRGLKIYPAFYLMLVVTLVVFPRFGFVPSGASVAAEALFVQNYFPGIWPHTWSLGVEEQFYLILAAAFAAAVRWSSSVWVRRVPAILGALAVAMLGLRVVALSSPYGHLTHLYPIHLRADSLGFGVLLSYYWNYHHETFVARLHPARWLLFTVGLLLMSPPFFFVMDRTPWLYTLGLTALYVGAGFVLVALLLARWPNNPLVRGLAFVGVHSYSIYLWHFPVIVWWVYGLRLPGPVSELVVAQLASIAVGIAAARLVEVPTLKLRERLCPSRVDDGVSVAPPLATSK